MQAVAAGHLNNLVNPWVPWWQSGAALNLSLRADGTRAVQPGNVFWLGSSWQAASTKYSNAMPDFACMQIA